LTQDSFITMAAALNMKWATDRDRSFTPSGGEIRKVLNTLDDFDRVSFLKLRLYIES